VIRRELPNALTIARILLIPVYVALITTCDGGRSWAAALVFGAAGITDQVDGFLARRWQVESAFGKIADPLADRLMIDAAVLLLIHAGRLPRNPSAWSVTPAAPKTSAAAHDLPPSHVVISAT